MNVKRKTNFTSVIYLTLDIRFHFKALSWKSRLE